MHRKKGAADAEASVKPERMVSAANAAPYASADPDFWAVIDGYEYALHDVHRVTDAWVAQLRMAAADAWLVFVKASKVAAHLDLDALREMGFPPAATPLLAQTFDGLPTLCGRFDFIESADGFKLVEFNAETPFFVVETHRINGLAAREAGLRDPNAQSESMTIAAMRDIGSRFEPSALLAVTASNVFREDYFTARYLASLWEAAIGREVPVLPIHELYATEDGLYHQDRRIDVLHRCYPLEYMAIDAGGRFLPRLIAEGRLQLINPPSALFAQNKLTQALIWGLYERNEYFNDDERAAIARTFLPSYADAPAGGKYVQKPALGREGSAVTIFEGDAVVERTQARHYESQPALFQQYVEAPTLAVRLSSGATQSMHAIATCAVVAGIPTAVGMRVGASRITDGWAHFQPLAIWP